MTISDQIVVSLCFSLLLATGCGDSPPKTPAEGARQQVASKLALGTNLAVVLDSEAAKAAALVCVQTGLSPATLFRTRSNTISFFSDIDLSGRGAPSHAAFSTRGGPRAFKNGEPLEAAHMEENWVIVWFADAPGWTNYDCPWVVYLQHKPKSMRLDTNGLHFNFRGAAGDTVLLPLYGNARLPIGEGRPPAQFAGKKVKTSEWATVLRREPLMRVRYWASALREFPLCCDETFERSNDLVIIRQQFHWHSIRDDWETKPLKLTTVNPALALAFKERRMPVTFSPPVLDLDMPTPYGPLLAAEGRESVKVSRRESEKVSALSHFLTFSHSPATHLIQNIETPTGAWPVVTLLDRRSGTRDSFGQVRVRSGNPPAAARRVDLGRNTSMLIFSD
ncbi:MAG: hypothetical protein L0Y58_21810 [Verrucomicrobia subdivision 3 bacterium]|nr:hypothetical protein [Limisphaerales bacterium]